MTDLPESPPVLRESVVNLGSHVVAEQTDAVVGLGVIRA